LSLPFSVKLQVVCTPWQQHLYVFIGEGQITWYTTVIINILLELHQLP